jgi:polysaccharide deacetylase family protein (PEP-CTERM system associated)
MTVENILTIDLEDWFHICGLEEMIPETSWSNLESRISVNTSKILNILAERNVKATFFVLGFVAEGHPELIREIENAGHEVATHGYAHRQVYSITPRLFREDLKKAVRAISAVTSKPVTGYRAPEWSIRDDSLWGLDILQEEGFEYDSSMAPLPIIGNPSYSKIPHKFLPLGGGWGLRVFPYPMIRSAIRKLNKRGQSALIYLHPREFDADCPRLRLPLAKRFVLHARLERAEQRLHRLLDDFRFTSVSDVLRRLKKRPAKA